MNNKIISLLKEKNYSIPAYFFKHYKEFNITGDELVLIIYLINSDPLLDYKKMSSDLNLSVMDIMNMLSTLKDKKVITINLKKNEYNKFEEYVNLDVLYNKFFIHIINNEEESNIFSIFEVELGRTLSPYEYEIISDWKNIYSEEMIIKALKESILNGVNSLKYMDKILIDWDKKGFTSKVKNSSSEKVVVPDYDWLKDE